MMTRCFTLRWDDNSICVIEGIEAGFPCLVSIMDLGIDFYEVTIEARIEDWVSIERRLAPYV